MSTTLANITALGDDRRRTASGAVIDWTGNGFRGVNGALQVWNQIHDWPWQYETMQFYYNEGITYYPISSSLNFKAVADLRPTRTSERDRELYYVMGSSFDSDLTQNWRFAVQDIGQGKYLRVKYSAQNMSVNPCTSVTNNGTWVGASAISNLATDPYEYLDLNASLRFDYSGTSGTLTNSTFTAIDLSRYEKRSTFYLNIFLTSVTNLTSITLKIGSSSSNYITGTITTDYLGNTLGTGWNKIKLVWDGSTTNVGTPVASAIAYAQVTIAYSVNPSTTANRIENLFVAENIPMTMEYYSNNMVISAAGSKSQIFTNASNTTDLALWSGPWDYVNEAYINSLMEIISWINGAQDDYKTAVNRIKTLVEPLKSKLPSKRRYAEAHMTADVNGPLTQRGNPLKYNRRWW